MSLTQRIKDRLHSSGLDAARVRGHGYEALVIRNGVIVGRVYLGSVEDVERTQETR